MNQSFYSLKDQLNSQWLVFVVAPVPAHWLRYHLNSMISDYGQCDGDNEMEGNHF